MDFPPDTAPIDILSRLRRDDGDLRARVQHTLTLRRGDVTRMHELRQQATRLSQAAERVSKP